MENVASEVVGAQIIGPLVREKSRGLRVKTKLSTCLIDRGTRGFNMQRPFSLGKRNR